MFKGTMSYSAAMGIYILHGDGSVLQYFAGWSIQFKGSNDVYYVNKENSNIYVHKAKLNLAGCLPVNVKEERINVFKALTAVGLNVAWTDGNR